MSSLIKNIWKNKKLILEGLVNKVLAKEEVTKVANERKLICLKCPLHSHNAKKLIGYSSDRIDDHCILCGCNIELKTYSLHSSCPDTPPKWSAVVDNEEENLLIQQYIKDESKEESSS